MPAIAVGVLPAVIHGVGGVAIELGALEAEAFRRLQHAVAAFAGGGRIGNSHKKVSGVGMSGAGKTQ
jgi:hypothetical protein